MNRDQIIIHIDRFDGPLALLLYLVQREEMDIQQLDLTDITGQYLNYLKKMKELNFDIAGEFLYMASTLIYLKSANAVDEDEKKQIEIEETHGIQSKEDLIKKLQELERFQKMGNALWSLDKQGYENFARPRIDKRFHFTPSFKEMNSGQLINLMIDFIRKEGRKVQIIVKDSLSIKKKLEWLKEVLKFGQRFNFKNLLNPQNDKIQDVVMTFISMLELARLKRVELFQAQDSEEIYVDVVADLENFDVDTADGFDPIEASENTTEEPQPVMH